MVGRSVSAGRQHEQQEHTIPQANPDWTIAVTKLTKHNRTIIHIVTLAKVIWNPVPMNPSDSSISRAAMYFQFKVKPPNMKKEPTMDKTIPATVAHFEAVRPDQIPNAPARILSTEPMKSCTPYSGIFHTAFMTAKYFKSAGKLYDATDETARLRFLADIFDTRSATIVVIDG